VSALSAMLPLGRRASLFFSVTMTVGYLDCQPSLSLDSRKIERSFKLKSSIAQRATGPADRQGPFKVYAESRGLIDRS